MFTQKKWNLYIPVVLIGVILSCIPTQQCARAENTAESDAAQLAQSIWALAAAINGARITSPHIKGDAQEQNLSVSRAFATSIMLGLGTALGFSIYSNYIESGSWKLPFWQLQKMWRSMYPRNLTGITFEDVIGQDEAVFEVEEIVKILKTPDRYRTIGARLPKGILLYGPPGNGKTKLAKALAGEAGCSFFATSASEFDEKYVGVGAARIRNLFAQARFFAPSIIFIDEIDALRQHESMPSTALLQLLKEMDGFDENDSVIVVAATNNHGALDPALRRPGRFDRTIEILPPSMKNREKLFEYYLKKLPAHATDVSAKRFAQITTGFSAADIENMVNLAALAASRAGSPLVTHDTLDQAHERMVLGAKRDMERTPKQREKTAYHEAGHTLMQLLLGEEISRVSILPRGRSLGATTGKQKYETYSDYTEKELEGHIMVLQGGFVAEQITYGTSCPGVCNDLEQATTLARRMVEEFGMGETFRGIGSISTSEAMKHREDLEVETLLTRCLERTQTMLIEHKDVLMRLAKALVTQETLQEKEVYTITGITPKERAM